MKNISQRTYRTRRIPTLEALEGRQLLTVAMEVVADIFPGNKGSSISVEMFEYNGELYFSADDGQHGDELWKSDGTREGTQLVKDIHVGDEDANSRPGWFTEYQGDLYFSAFDTGNGEELWKTDGTTVGTKRVLDVNAGVDSSIPSELTIFKDEIIFSASDSSDNQELWRSDGTPEGTQQIADIRLGRSSAPGNFSGLYEYKGFLYFNARDNENGVELWRSDGTSEGTTLVIDADPGAGHSWPTDFFEFRGDLYFLAETLNPTIDRYFSHLFRVDHANGTAEQVVDLPIEFAEGVFVSGDVMYFAGLREDVGYELFRSDGTQEGTVLLRDIMSGPNDSRPRNFVEHNGRVYFAAGDSRDPETERPIYNLWSTDGTAFGTRKVSTHEIYNETTYVSFQDELYFSARSGEAGWELFKTDGTTNGTVVAQDIAPGPADSQALPKRVFGNELLFLAETEQDGWEIWAYDGTGSTMIETHLGSGDFTEDPDAFRFFDFQGDLVYVGSNPFDGAELNILRSSEDTTPQLAGDADGNGKVEFADFLILSTNFGKREAKWSDGDFDGNGTVEFADFLALSTNFGRTTAAVVDQAFATAF